MKFFKRVKKAIRKFFSVKVIPYMLINSWRIFFYRRCGYNIGKNVFIGMRCYLDDVEPTMFTVEDDVTISYGCYFCCHGERQPHTSITIKKGAYLGMRSNVVSGKNGVTIGENVYVGACALVINDIPANTTAVGVPAKVISDKGRRETDNV